MPCQVRRLYIMHSAKSVPVKPLLDLSSPPKTSRLLQQTCLLISTKEISIVAANMLLGLYQRNSGCCSKHVALPKSETLLSSSVQHLVPACITSACLHTMLSCNKQAMCGFCWYSIQQTCQAICAALLGKGLQGLQIPLGRCQTLV